MYKRQHQRRHHERNPGSRQVLDGAEQHAAKEQLLERAGACLLYTSDAADERSSVDLGGRRIFKKKRSFNRLGVRLMTDWRDGSRIKQLRDRT